MYSSLRLGLAGAAIGFAFTAVFGCSPQAPTASQISLLTRQAEHARAQLHRASADHAVLQDRLVDAQKTLADEPNTRRELARRRASLLEDLPSVERAYSKAKRRQEAFEAEYPDLQAAAREYVFKYTHAPAYGKDATAKAIASTLGDLQSMQSTRTNAVTQCRNDFDRIQAAIQDTRRRLKTLDADIETAGRTTKELPRQIASKLAEVSRLHTEASESEKRLRYAQELQRRLAVASKVAQATESQDNAQAAAVAVLVVVLFIAGVLGFSLWASTRVQDPAPTSSTTTSLPPQPVPPVPPPPVVRSEPRPWIVWLLVGAGALFLAYACTPPPKYPSNSKFWDTPEGHAIRDEQDYYDSKIPWGR
jgi:uncharacterized protein (DUF3084 family)